MGMPIDMTLPIRIKKPVEAWYRDVLHLLEVPPKYKSVKMIAMEMDMPQKQVVGWVEYLLAEDFVRMARRPTINKNGFPVDPKWGVNGQRGILAIVNFDRKANVRERRTLHWMAQHVVNELGGVRKYDGDTGMLREIAVMYRSRSEAHYREQIEYLEALAEEIDKRAGLSEYEEDRRKWLETRRKQSLAARERLKQHRLMRVVK